jgi:single-strand DNA-binding protein
VSSDLNSVVIVGRLTRDPELKAVGQTSVCNLGIANNYSTKVNEVWEDRPNFFDVQVWGRRGEVCAEHLTKGRQVVIKGQLRWRSWEAQDGTKRSAVSINADEVQFVGPREEGGSRGQDSRDQNIASGQARYGHGNPANDSHQSQTLRDAHAMAAATFAETDVGDDEIPW